VRIFDRLLGTLRGLALLNSLMITTLQASTGEVDRPKMIAAEYLPIPGIAVRTFIASSSGICARCRSETV